MLAQLTQDLKERLLSEGMLNKLVLINIAAEAYAAIRRTGTHIHITVSWLGLISQ